MLMLQTKIKRPRLMRKYLNYRSGIVASLSILLLQACDGGGGGGDQPGVNGTYLHISTPDFYFGTKDIGSEATQKIRIENRGADVYPLESINIEGENAEEFSADVLNDVVLNPAEAITVGITFQPITDGTKNANLVVNYDTIKKVAEAVNINEQNFYQGRSLENAGDYEGAKKLYSDYIAGDPVTVNKQRAAIKLPVIKESEIYGDDEDFPLYLSALDLRDSGDFQGAIAELEAIQRLYYDGYLGDDAVYLHGYIQLMDLKDYSGALKTMRTLRQYFPDSTYYDTALYSEAIAEQELGNHLVAREILLDLKYRHTGVSALGVELPKDNLVSRLWFDRANDALASMDTV